MVDNVIAAAEIMGELTAAGEADSGDTNEYPQYAQSDEADCPQHCANCGEFLENDLTDEGVEYVKGLFQEHRDSGRGTKEVLQQWSAYYDIPLEPEADDEE